ncbi:MAG: lipoprotein-releasing system permease protein [Roseivirga sp.]|jgi:lipoprotein-releasing system permease protein
MIGVAIGTAALIVVLSVFNGLQDLIQSTFNSFDPQLKIEADLGKSFKMTPKIRSKIEAIEDIRVITEVIEDNALILYRDQQVVARVKGFEESYLQANRLDSFLVRGEMKLTDEYNDYMILGTGIAYELGLLLESDAYNMQVVYPRKLSPGAPITRNPIRKKSIFPTGIFNIESEYNESYVFVPLRFIQDLMDYGDRRTSVEIYLAEGASLRKVKSDLIQTLGSDFKVLDSDEIHSSLLKAIQIEKLFMFITLSFIMAIASFNIFFTLSILAIEKKRDISILYSFGATPRFVRQIFLKQGSLISLIGASTGLLFGLSICLLQQKFGLIGMGLANSIVNAYPVKLELMDFLLVGLSIGFITIITSYRPAIIASRVEMVKNLN